MFVDVCENEIPWHMLWVWARAPWSVWVECEGWVCALDAKRSEEQLEKNTYGVASMDTGYPCFGENRCLRKEENKHVHQIANTFSSSISGDE